MISKIIINTAQGIKKITKITKTKLSTNSGLKFEDGKLFNSLNSVTVPAKIGHKNIKIVIDVIDSELPFFLNKNEMKMAKAKVDFDHDNLNIIGQNRDQKSKEVSEIFKKDFLPW